MTPGELKKFVQQCNAIENQLKSGDNENDETFREITVEDVVTLIQRVKNSWIIEEPGFDPGDKLIAINGTNVEDMDRDSVLRLLKEGVGGRMLQVRSFF